MLNFDPRSARAQVSTPRWIKLVVPSVYSTPSNVVVDGEENQALQRVRLCWGDLSDDSAEQGSIFLPCEDGQSISLDGEDERVLVIRRGLSTVPSSHSNRINNIGSKKTDGIQEEVIRFAFAAKEEAKALLWSTKIAFPCRVIKSVSPLVSGQPRWMGLDENKRLLMWATGLHELTPSKARGVLLLNSFTRIELLDDDDSIVVRGRDVSREGQERECRFKLDQSYPAGVDRKQILEQYVTYLKNLAASHDAIATSSVGNPQGESSLPKASSNVAAKFVGSHEEVTSSSERQSIRKAEEAHIVVEAMPWLLRIGVLAMPFLVKTLYLFVTDAATARETARTVGEDNYNIAIGVTSSLISGGINAALPMLPIKMSKNPILSLLLALALAFSLLSIFWRFALPQNTKNRISYVVSMSLKFIWLMLLAEGLLLVAWTGLRGRVLISSSAFAFLAGVIVSDDHLGFGRIMRIFKRSVLPLQLALHIWYGDFLRPLLDHVILVLRQMLMVGGSMDEISLALMDGLQDNRETILKCASIGLIVYAAPNSFRVAKFYVEPLFGSDSFLNHPAVFRYVALGVLLAVNVDKHPDLVSILAVLATVINPRVVSSFCLRACHFLTLPIQNVLSLLAVVGMFGISIGLYPRELHLSLACGFFACGLLRLFYLPRLGRVPSMLLAMWMSFQSFFSNRNWRQEWASSKMQYLISPQCVDDPAKEMKGAMVLAEFANDWVPLSVPLAFLIFSNLDWIVIRGPVATFKSISTLISLVFALRFWADSTACAGSAETYVVLRTALVGRALFTFVVYSWVRGTKMRAALLVLYMIGVSGAFHSHLLLIVSCALSLLHAFLVNDRSLKRVFASLVVVVLLLMLSQILIQAGALNIPAGIVWTVCIVFELGHASIRFLGAPRKITIREQDSRWQYNAMLGLKAIQVLVVLPFAVLAIWGFVRLNQPFVPKPTPKLAITSGLVLAPYAALVAKMSMLDKRLALDFGASTMISLIGRAFGILNWTHLSVIGFIVSTFGLFVVSRFDVHFLDEIPEISISEKAAHLVTDLFREASILPIGVFYGWFVYFVHIFLLHLIPSSLKGLVRPRTVLLPVGILVFLARPLSLYLSACYFFVSLIIGLVDFQGTSSAREDAYQFARLTSTLSKDTSTTTCPTCAMALSEDHGVHKREVDRMPLCGHVFHESCIAEFISHERCPVCLAPTELWWAVLAAIF